MPIDISFQYAPVSSFPQRSPGEAAGGPLSVGRAVSDAGTQIEGALKERQRLRNERELLQARSRLDELTTARALARESRLYYGGDELENTDFIGERFERDPSGQPRPKEIPAWQAEPYLRKRDALMDAENAASGISDWELRQRYLADARERANAGFRRDLEASLAEGVAQTRWEIAREIQQLTEIGRHDEAELLLGDTTVFSREEKAEMFDRVAKDSEFYAAKELLVRPSWDAGHFADAGNMIERLGSDDYRGPLNQDERISLIASLRQRMAQQSTRESAKASAEQVRYEMALRRNIKSPLEREYIDEARLWQDHQDGLLTLAQYKSLTGLVITRDIEGDATMAAIARIGEIVQTGIKPAATPENKKDTDKFYQFSVERYIAELPEGEQPDPQQVIGLGLEVAKQTGIVPSQVQQQIMAGEAGDAEQMLLAAQLFNTYQSTVPEAVRTMSPGTFPTVASVAARLELGVPPRVAIEAAIKTRDASPAQREVNKRAWQDFTRQGSGKGGKSQLDNSLRQFLESDPMYSGFGILGFNLFGGMADAPEFGAPQDGGIPLDARAIYSQLVESYFMSEGSLPVAEKRAQRDFRSIYTLTNINNPGGRANQLIAYAPVSDEFGAEQMRAAIDRQFANLLPEGKRLYVYSDADTLSTGRIDPLQAVFKVVAVDDDGTPEFLGVWGYDTEQVRHASQLRAHQQELEALKARRSHLRRIAQHRTGGAGEALAQSIRENNERIAEKERLIEQYQQRAPSEP